MRPIAHALLSAGFAALFLAAGAASALDIVNLQYDRAFSPNGDGSQDSTKISFEVQGDSVAVDSIHAGIYALADVPPAPEHLHIELFTLGATGDTTVVVPPVVWDGRDDEDELLTDGFYYLHIYAEAGGEELWRSPADQLEINTAGPTFHSVFVEPSPFFPPKATGADTLVHFFFNSTDFDTLTDIATATILREDPEGSGYAQVAQAVRDPAYFQLIEGVPRFRVSWSGKDDEEQILDGRYRADLRLEDYAGNPAAAAPLYFDLDALAPVIGVLRFGEGGEGQLSFHFRPESLPDSLLLSVVDRNGTDTCLADWGFASPLDSVAGILQPESTPDTSIFYFPVPTDSMAEDGSYSLAIDALDAAGNWASDLAGVTTLTINVDSEAPPVPTWTTSATVYIQAMVFLSGLCTDFSARVHIYEDGDSVTTSTVDTQNVFTAFVQLSEGTHDWTTRSEDDAGNLSALSEALSITYTPGPAIAMPGRFRGGEEESIRVNSAEDATGVTMRVYSLDGDLLCMLDAVGGPREFVIDWDLKDENGRDLLGGLYIVNLCTSLSSGERSYERKVVAIVRD